MFDTAPLFLIEIDPDSISIPFEPSMLTTPVPCGVSPILPLL